MVLMLALAPFSELGSKNYINKNPSPITTGVINRISEAYPE